MANWVTDTERSTFEQDNYVTRRAETRNASREGFAGYNTGNYYNVVGINAQKVGLMRIKIREYVEAIYNHLDKIDAETDANIAYKGEDVQAAVKNYINSLKTYCKKLTSDLLAFSDKLGDVEDAWIKYQKQTAENINSAAGGLNEGNMYQEMIR